MTGNYCEVTVRRPSGQVETIRHPQITNMTETLLAQMRQAMAAAGKGEVLSYVNHVIRAPRATNRNGICPRCGTYCDGDCRAS